MKKIILFSTFFCALSVPFVSYAQIPYGGMVVGTPIPCTVSPGTFLYWFAPLFLGPIPITGDLVGLPVVTFPFFNLTHSGQWALGFMEEPGACVIGVCPICTVVPALGVILPFTGTSI